jgi:hypothetical protein
MTPVTQDTPLQPVAGVPHLVWKRNFVKIAALIVLGLVINLSLDSKYCLVPPCLTKSAAYRSISVGMTSDQAQSLLFRAGVFCPGRPGWGSPCTVFMFSDFWRDYYVEIVPGKRIVREKKFGFRLHGKGLLGILHVLR